MSKNLSSEAQRKKRVLLIMPGRYGVKDVNLPLPLLMLSKPLLEHGFEPVIFDCRLRNYEAELRHLKDFVCVGITSMSGEQVKHALDVSKHIKKINPELKIVWGGPHSSTMPEQTVKNKNVDVVVRGEGEDAMLEIADAIRGNKSLHDVQGITFKDKNGRIISTPDRPMRDINQSPCSPYHLVSMEKDYTPMLYKFEYISSKGCPHRCEFCSNAARYYGKWVAKSPEVVVKELDDIIKRFHPKRIVFHDSNFFVSRKRVEEICKLIIEKKWDVEFYAMIRCDYIVRYADEFFQLLKKAGFKELAFGGESGNQRVLNLIKKDITVKQILDSVKVLKRNGFDPIISFMVGLPSETEKELNDTLDLCDEIWRIHKHAKINGVAMFTPLPGTEITKKLVEQYHYKLPKKLEGWAEEWRYNNPNNFTWLNKRIRSKYEGIYLCSRIIFVNQWLGEWSYKEKLTKFGTPLMVAGVVAFNKFFNALAKARWRMRFFNAPLELKIWQLIYSRAKGMA